MSPEKQKTVWIDLDNSPHVPFFFPIIKKLEEKGYRLVITSRDCFQVCGLACLYNLSHVTIGRHYGANKALKVFGTLLRSILLLPTVIREKPDVSISHGSRPLIIISALLRIRSILIFDYEHAKSLPFLKPTLGMAPSVIQNPEVKKHFRQGYIGYQGLKEDVYVASFKPNPKILDDLKIDEHKLIVTIRPPANEAHYHNPESEKLFSATVDLIGNIPDAVMVILPRNEKTQKEMIINTWPEWYQNRKIIIPEKVVNGLDLIWYSDFVISGGGTMNREAAALGVPVYSIFRGKLGDVDKYLSENGRLTLLQSVADIQTNLKPIKRDKPDTASFENLPALKQIIEAIDTLAVGK
ncbi:MAG: DUF354 domain-containing protein [Deltaproteobacteria bacterium]|nr:DUF354 domain-containing protein [Deltaproteobacteria bacterium]